MYLFPNIQSQEQEGQRNKIEVGLTLKLEKKRIRPQRIDRKAKRTARKIPKVDYQEVNHHYLYQSGYGEIVTNDAKPEAKVSNARKIDNGKTPPD